MTSLFGDAGADTINNGSGARMNFAVVPVMICNGCVGDEDVEMASCESTFNVR